MYVNYSTDLRLLLDHPVYQYIGGCKNLIQNIYICLLEKTLILFLTSTDKNPLNKRTPVLKTFEWILVKSESS